MKVALVHDYLREYGGAERVLEALSEAFPDAPIYTAFYKKDSNVAEKFKDKKIITSWAQNIPFFKTRLHSPLRFLAPFIWNNFDFRKYDVVISSASWYVTKGFTKKGSAIEICYCHTPPRWLYGFRTSIEFQKYWPIKIYAMVIGHFMRMYDFRAAQRVNYFIANSQETAARIKKFYRRDADVIYPPVSLPEIPSVGKQDYYFMVARLVGAKGLDMAVEAANETGIKLKIAGVSQGYSSVYKTISKKAQKNIEFLGYVSDEELVRLYAGAKAFFALSQDEDFGITPVESMLCGTPVIAFDGGGYKETVVDGKTGIFFKEPTVDGLVGAIKKFEKLKLKPEDCKKQANKFSKERFIKEIQKFVTMHS